MTDKRKELAINLRSTGMSIKAIAKELNAAQSSISIWTRHVKLTDKQVLQLKKNAHLPEVVEKRRQSRIKSELTKRTGIINEARTEIGSISHRELWLAGTCLYWAEGSKTQSTVQFANGDPSMIILMLRYFREICHAEEQKIRGGIHIHEHLDTQAAEEYWQNITRIPRERFYKTYNKPNKSSKGLRNSLPYGVCDIYVHDYRLLLKIKGWISGIYDASKLLV